MIIDVLGLGETVNEFNTSGNITIGVNDIWKHHPTDYIVCVDRINAFTPERLKIIKESNPTKFYSHLSEWKEVITNFQLMILSSGRGNLKDIDKTFSYSNNSAYVAVVLAYKLGATKINIFGVDFNTHKSFKDNMLKATLEDYRKLFAFLKSKGIKITVTKSSKLNQLKY